MGKKLVLKADKQFARKYAETRLTKDAYYYQSWESYYCAFLDGIRYARRLAEKTKSK